MTKSDKPVFALREDDRMKAVKEVRAVLDSHGFFLVRAPRPNTTDVVCRCGAVLPLEKAIRKANSRDVDDLVNRHVTAEIMNLVAA